MKNGPLKMSTKGEGTINPKNLSSWFMDVPDVPSSPFYDDDRWKMSTIHRIFGLKIVGYDHVSVKLVPHFKIWVNVLKVYQSEIYSNNAPVQSLNRNIFYSKNLW